MIEFKNVSKQYPGNIIAVKNASFKIKPDEFVSIVGQSGAGKSTLVRLLMAEERPTRGRIIVGGWDITDIRRREIPELRRQIGVVYQDYKLLPKKTVFENVAFALEVCGEPGRKIKTVVPQVLRIVGLEDRQRRYPLQLSGGEQQRVSIVRAVAHEPAILFADEPTANLDNESSRIIMNMFLELHKKRGQTIIMVTHEEQYAKNAQRLVKIDDGRIVSDEKLS